MDKKYVEIDFINDYSPDPVPLVFNVNQTNDIIDNKDRDWVTSITRFIVPGSEIYYIIGVLPPDRGKEPQA